MNRLFRPTLRQLGVIAPLGLLTLAYAFYMRYGVIQNTPIGLACDAGAATPLCAMRTAVIVMFQHAVFGAVAVIAALINLLRPSLPLFILGMIVAALGIVLYNVAPAALAVALLIFSLARPAAGRAQG